MDTGGIIQQYLVELRRRNYQPTTIRQQRNALTAWADFLHTRNRCLLDAGEDDVHDWLDARPIGPRTRYGYLSILRAFYKWARVDDPTELVVRPRLPRTLPRPISTDDLEYAIRNADPVMRAWLTLMAFAGLRCMEVAGLRRQDITATSIRVVAGKGGHERVVPSHRRINEAVDALGVQHRGVMWRRSAHYVSATVARYFDELGLDATAHQLRHWYGTHVYRVSRDLRLTQQLLGHASPVTTAGYAAASMDEAANVISRLG